jgi:hypothetical protein
MSDRIFNAPSELTIILRPYDAQLCMYSGTRAQLEAEGVIPDNVEWPLGFESVF